MELKIFVSEAITQIAEGICEAQSATKDKGVMINPPLTDENKINTGNKINFVPQTISFDVSVSVEAESSTGGKGKIQIATFGLELGKTSGGKDTYMSRLSFSVPVCWTPACEPESGSNPHSVHIAPMRRSSLY